MTTVNENKIIADFMGFQHTPIGWFDADELLKLPNTTDNTFDELRFDVDWDWLMGVVDKIESLGYDVQIIYIMFMLLVLNLLNGITNCKTIN